MPQPLPVLTKSEQQAIVAAGGYTHWSRDLTQIKESVAVIQHHSSGGVNKRVILETEVLLEEVQRMLFSMKIDMMLSRCGPVETAQATQAEQTVRLEG